MAAARPRAAPARAAALPGQPRVGPARAGLAAATPSWRSLAAALVIAGAAVGLYQAAQDTSMFAVREVRVEGAKRDLARQIRRELSPLVGQSLVRVDGADVLSRLEALPAVRSATYDRAFPHTLVVSVVPERPVAVLRRGAESWLLSARARALAPLPQGTRKRLPRIWVPKAVEVRAGGIVDAPDVRRAVRVLRPAETRRLPIRVRSVRARRGELAFVLANGLEVRLGDTADVALKAAVTREILPLLAHPAAGGPTYLDVSVPERPVTGGTLKSEVEVEG